MTSFAGTAVPSHRRQGPVGRGWEIAGIVLGFVFAWPLAVGYVAWKFSGYPTFSEMRGFFEQRLGWSLGSMGRHSRRSAASRFHASGNSAFEEYRARELQRLDEERRRLDEESRAFGSFVEELKRAKDREEFDAFMAKRQAGNPS